MAKNEKTFNPETHVCLPIAKSNESWVLVPSEIVVDLIADAGTWTMRPAELTPAMTGGFLRKGGVETMSDAAARSKDKVYDTTKAQDIRARIAKVESGDYVFGAHGPKLSPWLKILRDDVSAYFQNMTKAKKVAADKAVSKDLRATFESAFQVECNDIGLGVTPETAEAEFEAMTKTAQESADRIAAAKLSDVDKRLARLTALKAATK